MKTAISKLTTKYQATIPEPIRKVLHLGAGDVIAFDIEDNVFISKDDLDLLDVGFTAIGHLASTIGHNIQNNLDEDAKYFQRGSWDYQFDPKKMDRVRKAIHRYLRKEDTRSRNLITSLAESGPQKGQLTAGISMFYFEEEPPA